MTSGILLRLARFLRVAGHDLDLVRKELILSVRLELHILHKERPHVVAEPICFEMSLYTLITAPDLSSL